MVKGKISAVILANELPDDHILWVKACEFFSESIHYRIVNLTHNTWLEEIQSGPFDILLAKPGCLSASFKQLYDERINILTEVLGYKVFPSLNEILIYENKRYLSYWLKANHIQHPKTFVFYNSIEANKFIQTQTLPLVAKFNIGASGSGVEVLKTYEKVVKYIHNTFKGKGAPRRTGPNIKQARLFQRGFRYILHPGEIVKKFGIYKLRAAEAQKSFVIFQEFIPHEFEWRVVRIGESFFAHKKLKLGEMASGSLLKNYDNPPLSIFDFVLEITNRFNFRSVAIDIFEADGKFLVNEIQCIFGQSDPYQMLIDGKPGRYIHHKNSWIFEEGEFNANECYNLRIQHILGQF